jgi:predicted DNA-binding transcriptional regulator AlpA
MIDSTLIRSNELAKSLGVSKTTLWRWRRAGFFPEPIQIGPRLIAWKSSEIQFWLENSSSWEVEK